MPCDCLCFPSLSSQHLPINHSDTRREGQDRLHTISVGERSPAAGPQLSPRFLAADAGRPARDSECQAHDTGMGWGLGGCACPGLGAGFKSKGRPHAAKGSGDQMKGWKHSNPATAAHLLDGVEGRVGQRLQGASKQGASFSQGHPSLPGGAESSGRGQSCLGVFWKWHRSRGRHREREDPPQPLGLAPPHTQW